MSWDFTTFGTLGNVFPLSASLFTLISSQIRSGSCWSGEMGSGTMDMSSVRHMASTLYIVIWISTAASCLH